MLAALAFPWALALEVAVLSTSIALDVLVVTTSFSFTALQRSDVHRVWISNVRGSGLHPNSHSRLDVGGDFGTN